MMDRAKKDELPKMQGLFYKMKKNSFIIFSSWFY